MVFVYIPNEKNKVLQKEEILIVQVIVFYLIYLAKVLGFDFISAVLNLSYQRVS